MDSSWQQMKCSSTWPSQTPLPPPLQLPSSSDSRNRMDVNVGHYLHPYIAQRASSMEHAIIPEPLVFSTLNLGSSKSGRPEPGNSFLALLSGPSQQFECDFQQLSNPKAPVAVSKLPIHNNNIIVSGNGCGVPVTRIGPLPQLHGNESIGSAVELCPDVLSRVLPTSTCNGVAILHSRLQNPNLRGAPADSAKPVLHHAIHDNDMGMEVSSLRLGRFAGAGFTNASQHHTANIQTSLKLPSEIQSASLVLPSAFTRGKPRVFCLGSSGDLLLSDMGFLGVVCSCHGLPMSVAKFCEHAGACAVNPGDAVRLESGETIAQWCKGCFLKFGMRVPDDINGWDWPSGIPAPGGLVKGKSTTVSNMSKHFDAFQQVDSFGGSMKSAQAWNDFVYPNNPSSRQNVLEKSVNKIMHSGQQRNSMEGHNVLKSFAGTSHNILPSQAGHQMLQTVKESSTSILKCSLDKVIKNNGHPSIDFISKGGNSFIADPSFRISKSFGTATNFNSYNNLRETLVTDVDAAIPSNIELRLGQPSQQSRTLGDSTPPVTRSVPFGSPFDIPKSQFYEPLLRKDINPRVTEDSRQNLWRNPSEISSSNEREKDSELDLVCHALRSLNAMGPAKLEQLKGDATKIPIISMFFPHFSNPSEGDMQFHVPKHKDNMVSNGEHCMTKVLDGDSHIAKYDPVDFPRNRTDALNSKLNINGPFHSHCMDKGKGSRTVSDNCYVAAKPNTLFYNKQMTDSELYAKFVSETCLRSSSAVHDKVCTPNLHQSAVILADASDTRNFSNQFGKAPCLEDGDNLGHILRLVSSGAASVTSVSGVSTSAVPVGGFSSSNLINLSNKRSNDVSQHMLDENLSLLAMRHLFELSKQENSSASLEMNPEQGRVYCPSVTEMQRMSSKEDLIASEELRPGSCLTHKQDESVVAARPLQSFCNHYSSDSFEKFGMAGEKNCFNFSTTKQRVSLCSNELGAKCIPCHDRGSDDQPSLRLGRIGNKDSTDSGEHERCGQKELNRYLPGNRSCAVHSTCLTQSCISTGETSINASKHTEYVGGKAPALFFKDHIIPRDQSVVPGRSESLKRYSAQWKDVPSKVTGNCNSPLIERPAKVVDAKEVFEDQLADTAAKGFGGMTEDAESLKEQQMSNVCSGFSAPALTEVSIGVNNAGSCTMDDGDGRYMHNLVVDEGSGIEKCSSSDDALGKERWAQTVTVLGKTASYKEWCSSMLPRQPSHDLIDEIKLTNSFRSKEARNRIQTGCTVQEHTNHTRQFDHGPKAEKGRKTMKWKRLDASFPASGLSPIHNDSPNCKQHSELYLHLSKEKEASLHDDHCARKRCCIHTCGPSSVKRKRSAISSTKSLSRKRNFHGFEEYNRECEDDYQTQLRNDLYLHRLSKPKVSAEKKVNQDWATDLKKQFLKKDVNHVDAGKVPKYMSRGCTEIVSFRADTHYKKARPVVCGNSGIISNGILVDGLKKPAKIVSLRSILKIAKRCTITENDVEAKNACLSVNEEGCHDELSYLKKERDNGIHNAVLDNEVEPRISSMLEMRKASSCWIEGYDEPSILKIEKGSGGEKAAKLGAIHRCSSIQMKPRFKETRKRSLYELTGKSKSGRKPDLSNLVGNDHYQIVKEGLRRRATRSALVNAFRVKHPSSSKFCPRNSKCSLQPYLLNEKSCLKNSDNNQDHPGEPSQPNTERYSIKGSKSDAFVLDSDAFCCVCGSSKKDGVNRLLECCRCLIRVHQACYGVSKAPKGRWSCRPCRANSKNIACVLCGYEGGAMTRALRSQNIVKSLLDGWKVGEAGPKSVNSITLSEDVQDDLCSLHPTLKGGASRLEELESVTPMRPMDVEPFCRDVLGTNLENNIPRNIDSSLRNFQARNTITAGVLDPTVTQWVHMVCGLWMPGTRCPNVDTMSTFDVSGASRPKKNMVCSICSRLGGSCIRCRVPECSVHFHPWCAHQKGLLQSEVEGVDNDKVGFYARCLLHAFDVGCHTSNHPVDAKIQSPREKEFTCARTEGYKGRKSGEGFRHKFHLHADGNSGCLVPQEQINAWLHINGHKSCIRGVVKPQASDIEHDCRKEYARYKQAKGWRHLVVYKSGIHALGLYTSQFISRGAMVVEYVGEIVGLRVADKREIEYQSGRKVQYKSACYFFRIDKEHIIDATRKGGIARFVNHSCLPNCVAKVISVRNEKKVVFFAERDINPGEEITYDYHFNHEDEGKKIPCFCNSKNCRRYLN